MKPVAQVGAYGQPDRVLLFPTIYTDAGHSVQYTPLVVLAPDAPAAEAGNAIRWLLELPRRVVPHPPTRDAWHLYTDVSLRAAGVKTLRALGAKGGTHCSIDRFENGAVHFTRWEFDSPGWRPGSVTPIVLQAGWSDHSAGAALASSLKRSA